MDAELEDWKSRGQYFDNLGFDVFDRREGSGPRLLLTIRLPADELFVMTLASQE